MSYLSQSCRAKFNQDDFSFLSEVFLKLDESPSLEAAFFDLVADPETLDSLLTHPTLLETIFKMGKSVRISAELYFYVLVRHCFKEAGLDHIELADYVAATLVEYAKGNPFKSTPTDAVQTGVMPYHSDFIEALNSASSYDRFYLHVQCGNQFLVLTGLYPEFIKNRENRSGAPGVQYYENVACQSYRSAGVHPLASEFALGEVYELLAEKFTTTRSALNRITQEYWV